MDIRDALKILIQNTSNEIIRQKASVLLESIRQEQSSYVSSGGIGDKVIIKVQRGENKHDSRN